MKLIERFPAKRLITEDYSQIQALFGDNAEIMASIIKNAKLDTIPVKLLNMHGVGGMYGINRLFIAKEPHRTDIQLFVILHEYGHAFRDIHNGPIYNYWLRKDTDGNDLSEEETLDHIAIEEDEASAWALQQLAPYPHLKIPAPRRSNSKAFAKYLQYIIQSGAQTAQDVEKAFLAMVT